MTKPVQMMLGSLILVAIVVLATIGQRVAPQAQSPAEGDSKKACHVEAPESLKKAAKEWCSNGLFKRIDVTGDDRNVIMAAQFSPSGAQTWQIQGPGLVPSFRVMTEQMAAVSGDRDVSVAIQDAAGKRVGACARLKTATAPTCSVER